jgi:hypothetical protein
LLSPPSKPLKTQSHLYLFSPAIGCWYLYVPTRRNWGQGPCDGLYVLGPGSGTIWRYGLVGIGVTWLEWVCHCGCGYKILILVAWMSVLHWQPLDEDIELSAPPALCLPGYCHAPTLMIMDWTSEPVSHPQLNVVFYKTCLGHGVCSQQ